MYILEGEYCWRTWCSVLSPIEEEEERGEEEEEAQEEKR
jgi:hypothetical protein